MQPLEKEDVSRYRETGGLTDVPELVLGEGGGVGAVVQLAADQRSPNVRHLLNSPSMLEPSESCRAHRVRDAPAELLRVDWLLPHCRNITSSGNWREVRGGL